MADKRVWFITGAGRGMGVDIAQAALGVGHAVVATGRNPKAVADTVGEADDLLVVELLAQVDAYRDLSSSLAFDEAQART
jgi:NAD(P)-dependent dehydrogenase (short-subunit alcohol dehydrogenase family)